VPRDELLVAVRSPRRRTRELVEIATILITDLVGSTALDVRVGLERCLTSAAPGLAAPAL
jgi:class 3 adenylate cyclase